GLTGSEFALVVGNTPAPLPTDSQCVATLHTRIKRDSRELVPFGTQAVPERRRRRPPGLGHDPAVTEAAPRVPRRRRTRVRVAKQTPRLLPGRRYSSDPGAFL